MKKLYELKSFLQKSKGFIAMVIAFMAMGTLVAQTQSYQLVTENQDDWSGTYLLISNAEAGTVAFSGFSTTSTIYGLGTVIDDYLDGTTIASNATTDGYQLTIAKTTSGTYTIATTDGQYFGWTTTKNTLNNSTSPSSNKYEWNIHFEGSTLRIVNATDAARNIQWNRTSPRFATYGNNGQTPCQLYKLQTVGAVAVEAPVANIPVGTYYAAQNVTLTSATEGASIYYTLDGTTPTSASTLYESPIAINATTTLKAIAVNGEDVSAVTSITYTINLPIEVANIAAFKAAGAASSDENAIYKITGDVTVVGQYSNRYHTFIQDATGALYIYGTMAKTYNPGDVISGGVYGTYSVYRNLIEMKPVSQIAMAEGVAGTPIEPVVVTLAQLAENYAEYEGKLVTVQGISFTQDRTFGTTSATKGATITQEGATGTFSVYNTWGAISNLSVTNGANANVTGYVIRYSNNIEILPRGASDIILTDPATVPFNVTFASNKLETYAWTINNGSHLNRWYVGKAEGFNNDKLFISSSNGVTNKYDVNSATNVSVYRDVTIPAIGAEFSFEYRVNGESSDYLQVDLIKEGVTTNIATLKGVNEWSQFNYSIPAEFAGEVRVQFTWKNNTGNGNQSPAAIDNIAFSLPTCLQPTNLVVTTDDASATITWTAPEGQDSWTLQYKLSNHSEWYTVNATSNTVTLNNLQGNSNYDVRVKANCDGESSIWVNGTFSVACLTQGLVPTEVSVGNGTTANGNFLGGTWGWFYTANLYEMPEHGKINSIAIYMPYGNSSSNAGLTLWVKEVPANFALASETTFANYKSGAVQIYEGQPDYTQGGWIEFPINEEFSISDGSKLLVLSKATGCTTSGGCAKSVYSSYAPSSTWYTRADYSDPGENRTGSLSAYLPNLKLNMDLLGCADTESCPMVTVVAVESLTPNSVEITWEVANDNQNSFIIEYKTANATDWTTVTVENANAYTISGLTQQTDYEARVIANCGTNDLSEPVTITFTTASICNEVSEIASNNTQNSTLLTWVAGGNETSWIVEFKPENADDNAWSTLTVSAPVAVISNLESNENYTVRIKAVCDAENQSNWVEYNFISGCLATDLPFAETFDNYTQPTCWKTNGFSFNYSYARTTQAGDWLMTPFINIPSDNSYYITFKAMAYGNYKVMISQTGENVNDFVPFYQGTSDDAKVYLEIPAVYAGRAVSFMFINDDNNEFSIDNVKINTCPFLPTELAASNILTNSFDLSWTNDGGAECEVQYKVQNSENWETISVTGNTTTITGLQPQTTYVVRVANVCGESLIGEFSSEITVTTQCAMFEVPYFEDFEDVVSATYYSGSAVPNCWTRYSQGYYNTTYFPSVYPGQGYAFSGSQSLKMSNYCSSYDQSSPNYGYQYVALPVFNVEDVRDLKISGWMKAYSDNSYYDAKAVVGICTDLTDFENTFTSIAELSTDNTSYEPFTISFNEYEGENGHIVFFVDRPTGNPSYNQIHFDDILVGVADPCFAPNSVSVSNATDISAKLSWSDMESEGGYVVAYKENSATDWTTIAAPADSISLTNLNPSTTYEVKVKTVCGSANESDYSDVITFSTACAGGAEVVIGSGFTGNINLPFYGYYGYSYSQQIYDAADINVPEGGLISEIKIYCTQVPSSSSVGDVRIWMGNTSKSVFTNNNDYISPSELSQVAYLSGNISFVNGWNTLTLSEPFLYDGTSNLVLAYYEGMNGYSSSSFAASQTDGAKSIHQYSDYSNAVSYTSPQTATTSYKYLITSRNNIMFSICPGGSDEPIVTCNVPEDIEVVNVTATTAEVSWIPMGEETEWNVEYGPAGFAHGTGTTISVTGNPEVTLANLLPQTDYEVYVQAVCTEEIVSVWSDMASFRTPCENSVVVALGSETNNTHNGIPVHNYYKYSYSQQIYTAEEIGLAGEINAISFEYAYSSPTTSKSDVKIYLANTAKEEFTSSSDWITEDLQLVYQGALNCTQGWNNFMFSTPFLYLGENIVLVVEDNSGAYNGSSYSFKVSSCQGNKAMAYRSDSNPFNNYSAYEVLTKRNNVRFSFCPNSTDLMLSSIAAINKACEINDPITIQVSNLGVDQSVSSFEAYYQVNDGTPVHETVTVESPLAFMDSYSYSFSQLPTFVEGNNTVTAWVELHGDANLANNQAISNVIVLEPENVPYIENFDNIVVNDGWNNVDANNDGVVMDINNAITYSFNDNMSANDWIISPCVYLPAGTYNMYYDYQANSLMEEEFAVYYGTSATIAGMSNQIASHTTNNADVVTAQQRLTIAQDGVYYFGFHAQSNAGHLGFSIDNFAIYPIVEVTVNAGANGIVTPSGVVEVDAGTDLTLEITPDHLYYVESLSVDGTQMLNEDLNYSNYMTYTLENVTESHVIDVDFKHEIQVLKVVENYNPLYTEIPGEFIPATTDIITDGNTHIVTFEPAANYHFNSLALGLMVPYNSTDVTADVVDNGDGTYSYTIENFSAIKNYVTATFRKDTVNVHYNILAGKGMVDASEMLTAPAQFDTWIDYGTSTTAVFAPAENYHIVSVAVNGENQGPITNYDFENVTTTQNVDVVFGFQVLASIRNAVPEYLNSTEVRGTIAPEIQLVAEFNAASVTGTIQPHFHLLDMFVDGVSVMNDVVLNGQEFSYTIASVENNVTVEAIVDIDTVGIHYSVIGGNAIVNGNDVVAPATFVKYINYGDDFLSTLTPAPGYRFESVTINGVFLGSITAYQFSNVQEEQYVEIVVVKDEFTITTTAYGSGTINPATETTMVYDPTYEYIYTVTPAEGNYIASITVNGEQVVVADPEMPYTDTLRNIVSDYDIVVYFEPLTFTIAASAQNGGMIAPSGVAEYLYNETAEYAIEAAPGYAIADVVVDGVSQGAISTYTFTQIRDNHTIEALFTQVEYTITVNAGANGTITPGTSTVASGASQTFAIEANEGYAIASVTVDGINMGTIDNYTFSNVTEDHSITATFVQLQYTIDASISGNGTITPAGATVVNYGANQTYNISVATGYHIVDVVVDGASVGAVNSYTFNNVQANHTIYVWVAANEFTVTVNAPTNGTITPGTQVVAYGATPSFTIAPNAGYSIATVTLNGANVTFTTDAAGVAVVTLPAVTANVTLAATMSQNTYNIVATAGANGSITPAGTTSVNYGDNRTYTISANAGYSIENVVVDGISMGAISSFTFTNVMENHTIAASFVISYCAAPSNTYITNLDETSVTLHWNNTGAPSYSVQYKRLTDANYTEVPNIAVNEYNLTGLDKGTDYMWRVKANCTSTFSSEWSQIKMFRTPDYTVIEDTTVIGITENELYAVQVYGYSQNVYIINNDNVEINQVAIFDAYGKLVYRGRVTENVSVISMNVASGIYVVRIESDNAAASYKVHLTK